MSNRTNTQIVNKIIRRTERDYQNATQKALLEIEFIEDSLKRAKEALLEDATVSAETVMPSTNGLVNAIALRAAFADALDEYRSLAEDLTD